MRKTLLMSAALLGTALALPAFAQTASSGGGMSGAAPMAAPAPQGMSGSSSQGMNETQPGTTGAGGSAAYDNATGSDNGDMTAGTGTQGGSMGGAGAQMGAATNHRATGMHQAQGRHHRSNGSSSAMNEGGARAGHAPGSGDSEPYSRRASNINQSDTRSEVAPRLPAPHVGENASASELLDAAAKAVHARHGGAAQEALERAETALLNNPQDPQRAGQADNGPAVQHIGSALNALAKHDFSGAEQSIASARQSIGQGGSAGMNGGMGTEGSASSQSSSYGGAVGTAPSGQMQGGGMNQGGSYGTMPGGGMQGSGSGSGGGQGSSTY